MNYKIKNIYCFLCDEAKLLDLRDWKKYTSHCKSHHNVDVKDISKIKIKGKFQSILVKSDDGNPHALISI